MRAVWIGLAGLALLGSGCAETDPYQREGMWQPTGANARNLAAMVESPRDLLRGRGSRGTAGTDGTVPVLRMWSGKPVPLPVTGSQASGPPQQGAAPPAQAGAS